MLRTILRRGFATQDVPDASHLFLGRGFLDSVEAALEATGRREKRQRSLPASLMLVFLVALSIYRHLSIPAVFRELFFWTSRGRRRLPLVTDEALVHAKERLGTDAPALLFQTLADKTPPAPSFHGMAVHGVDGVRLNMPDTDANANRFGRWKASNGDRTAFPQLLAVVLVATGAHQVRKVRFERCTASERDSALGLLGGLGSSDLLIFDRGFHAVWFFEQLLSKGIHFVCRATGSYKPRILARLGHGDYLVELVARVQQPDKSRRRVRLVLRMVEYRIGKRRRARLITDLVEHRTIKPLELARLYRERWECEIAYDEIKTHLAAPTQGALKLPFRSKNPDGVIQEAYALFTAYNLIRSWMLVAAEATGTKPIHLSFVGALQVIRHYLPELGSNAQLLTEVARKIAMLKIHRPRRPRWYHRVVRVKIVRFPRKRKWHQQQHIDYAAQTRLVNHYPARRRRA